MGKLKPKVGDLVKLLDDENYGTIGEILSIEPWDVLGTTVAAYTVDAASGDYLTYQGKEMDTVIYLEGLFEKL